ncbi:MAG TPA: DUF4231 domain-containing protein [Ktedonobacteraceae bacterium]|jgi:hypothetical protein|nr:DUF4231 domain-containing protein [Ktedonobacteraceae bacterium]
MLTPRRRSRTANTSCYPSEQYRHKSNDLWWQCQKELIDYTRYLELLEAIKTEEIDRQYKKYPILATEPETRDRIENGIWKYEQQSQDARMKEAHRQAEIERKKSLTPLEKYLEDTPGIIQNFRRESNNYRVKANFYQILIIVGSVLATSASSAVGFGLNNILRWIAPAISIMVAISAGLMAYFKFREKSFNLQQTADAIEQEYNAVELGIGYYKGKQPQEALQLFAEHVELLKDEQKKRQQQLEQPPDIKHGPIHP